MYRLKLQSLQVAMRSNRLETIANRWKHSVDKRLTTDRLPTNVARSRKNAMDGKLARAAWRDCLQEEEDLPANWPAREGFFI
jgi:hypothetical protein